MGDNFNVIDENGIQKKAEIITGFSYKDKEYILYSIDEDTDNSGIFVSALGKDSEGNDILLEIEDDSEREEVHKVVEELLDKMED